ncbi:circadian locomoter output cycles protein kaput isoform X2 [Zophobas morio]|uniref:circadian locomoter output cycles protein kaput isoform X2 n=1 Tax=Zophobas morio TaxID=2755281 RepID=UPI003082E47E
MSSIKKSSTRRSDDTMDDDSDDKDSKRKSRNLSEKKRRDQFNMLINELSSMVATGSRKMDKSTVLKSTIAFLKNHNEIAVRSRVNEIQEDWKPTFLTNEEFTHLVLEAVDGFIMIFSASGQIYYASESITSLLGHLPNEVLNTTIYDMANEEEHSYLYNILITPSEEQGQVSFACHLRRGDSDSKQNPSFELVNFVGYFRSDEDMVQSDNRYSGYSGEADTRLVFVGTGKVQTPRLIKEMPLVDSSKSEFTSRHSLEWKFLFLDHRAPPIIGYLPFELLGTSGYDYYHIDDLDDIISGHKALMQKGEGTSCYYRFLTKGQQWIWLQTRYYITYHQWNSKPEFIVCTNRVVSYADIKQTRKDDNVVCVPGPSPVLGNGAATANWPGNNNNKSIIRPGTASECTSLSADSQASRQSAMTQYSVKSKSSYVKAATQMVQPQQPQPQIQTVQTPYSQPPHQNQQFLEPPQYVAAIPMQPVVPGFSPTGVLSPLQQLDNVLLTPTQTQLQLDLQRKHAELQALIGQQQAELRRVSEQLLMARLGLLPQDQNVPMPYQGANSGAVSSTTATGIQSSSVGSPSLIVPVSMSLPLPQHQPNMLYTLSDISGQTKSEF